MTNGCYLSGCVIAESYAKANNFKGCVLCWPTGNYRVCIESVFMGNKSPREEHKQGSQQTQREMLETNESVFERCTLLMRVHWKDQDNTYSQLHAKKARKRELLSAESVTTNNKKVTTLSFITKHKMFSKKCNCWIVYCGDEPNKANCCISL